MKPLMTKHTLSKINFFTEEECDWLPVLHENLPLNCIPPQFGGISEMKPLWPFEKHDLGKGDENQNEHEEEFETAVECLP